MGDIFIFAVLPLYFGFFKTILSLQIASILGIFFILIKRLLNFIFFYIFKIKNIKHTRGKYGEIPCLPLPTPATH